MTMSFSTTHTNPQRFPERFPTKEEVITETSKPSNPKDLFGSKKFSISAVPMAVLGELSVAMQEGAAKYGRFNFRHIGVRASIYNDAVFRHMASWWEGEDIDPDSGVSHITKAIASLVVLRDAMMQENWVDDRPKPTPEGWTQKLNKAVEELAAKYPNPVAPFVRGDIRDEMVEKNSEQKTA